MLDLPAILNTSPIRHQARRWVGPFEDPEVQVLRVWPQPASWGWTPRSGWQPIDLDLRVHCADPDSQDDAVPPNDALGWSVPLGPLLATIPAPIREAAALQGNCTCWRLVMLLHDLPELLPLAGENRALAGLLAHQTGPSEDAERSLGSLRALLARPRKHLLPRLGLPPEKGFLRILERLEPGALDEPGPEGVSLVLGTATGQVLKWLRHLRCIRADVLCVLEDPSLQPLCSYSLLDDEDDVLDGGLHSYLLEIAVGRAEGWAALSPARFTSRRQVLEFSAALPPDSKRIWTPEEFPTPFEAPTAQVVLEGTPQVSLRHVPSAVEMQARALEDQHCIARQRKYPEHAARGAAAMYLAHWEEGGSEQRATVWLRLGRRGWEVEQTALPRNEDPPRWLLLRLEAWVADLNDVEEETAPGGPVQQALPLTFRHSALDVPGAMLQAPAQQRPEDLGYEDWWAWLG